MQAQWAFGPDLSLGPLTSVDRQDRLMTFRLEAYPRTRRQAHKKFRDFFSRPHKHRPECFRDSANFTQQYRDFQIVKQTFLC